MPPRQTKALTRLIGGALAVVVIPLMGWGFRTYDASKVNTATFVQYIALDSARHAFDSLNASYQYREIRAAQQRSDSTLRKICAAVVGSGC